MLRTKVKIGQQYTFQGADEAASFRLEVETSFLEFSSPKRLEKVVVWTESREGVS